ncbi:MAG: Asp23/Gls24 family envelope stress response protein, partial [Oscillospiraceae bacterium]
QYKDKATRRLILMDVSNQNAIGGSLQISTDVISKIATLSTMEIDGVKEVSTGVTGVKSFLGKLTVQRPVTVELLDDVAEITVSVIVGYGCKIPPLSEKIQENVKAAVQNMTSITVSKVNVVVSGVMLDAVEIME